MPQSNRSKQSISTRCLALTDDDDDDDDAPVLKIPSETTDICAWYAVEAVEVNDAALAQSWPSLFRFPCIVLAFVGFNISNFVVIGMRSTPMLLRMLLVFFLLLMIRVAIVRLELSRMDDG